MSKYMGLDYGHGQTNIDRATGIRFGVIAMNSLSAYAWDNLEANYGEPSCPKCGNDCLDSQAENFAEMFAEHWWENNENPVTTPAVQKELTAQMEMARDDCTDEYYCLDCAYSFDGDEAFGDEPIGYTLDDGGVIGESAFDNTELFVTKSPFFTYAGFCSPCAPGACDLDSRPSTGPDDTDGGKCYCLDSDWFDEEENPCPYAYWRVDTGELVYSPAMAKAHPDHHGELFHPDCPECNECEDYKKHAE